LTKILIEIGMLCSFGAALLVGGDIYNRRPNEIMSRAVREVSNEGFTREEKEGLVREFGYCGPIDEKYPVEFLTESFFQPSIIINGGIYRPPRENLIRYADREGFN